MTAKLVPDQQIDLRGTPCPINFIRCRLALEGLKAKERLQAVSYTHLTLPTTPYV